MGDDKYQYKCLVSLENEKLRHPWAFLELRGRSFWCLHPLGPPWSAVLACITHLAKQVARFLFQP